MDNYENVVLGYLRADRALFINTQYCIQINESENPDTSGPHWYCDAVVVDFRDRFVYLCETTYANTPTGLFNRLAAWNENWPAVCHALKRDSHLPKTWKVRPWVFVPEQLILAVVDKVRKLQSIVDSDRGLPDPRLTTLEMVQPWKYKSWNRIGENDKPATIPESMRI